MCSRPPDILGEPLHRQDKPTKGDNTKMGTSVPKSEKASPVEITTESKQVMNSWAKDAIKEAVNKVDPPGWNLPWVWVAYRLVWRIQKMKWFTWLQGKKTYITAIAMFIVGGCKALDWFDDQTANTILAMLAGLGLITLRSGVKSDTKGVSQ